jgi:hypothetical protein
MKEIFFLQSCNPFLGLVSGLFHKRPHRQAINEAARPRGIPQVSAIPKPRERDGGGFAKASWNVN